MFALLSRRKEIPMADTATITETLTETTAQKDDDNVLMRFLTQGGATVSVYATRFTTRWAGGPPFAAATPYEVSGFQWECAGCDAYGREGDTYHDPNYRDKAEARSEANAHADQCRSLPNPAA